LIGLAVFSLYLLANETKWLSYRGWYYGTWQQRLQKRVTITICSPHGLSAYCSCTRWRTLRVAFALYGAGFLTIVDVLSTHRADRCPTLVPVPWDGFDPPFIGCPAHCRLPRSILIFCVLPLLLATYLCPPARRSADAVDMAAAGTSSLF